MDHVRRVIAPIRVALLRISRRPGRGVLVSAGIALAAAMVVGVLVGTVLVQDRTVRHALSALPVSQRTFRVDDSGLGDTPYAPTDRVATRALALVTHRPPVRMVEVPDLRIGPELVRLVGVDDLRRWVIVRRGRLPRSCTPLRCEVLRLSPGLRAAHPSAPGINLVPVGFGTLVSTAPLGPTLASPGRAGPDLLLANGVRALLSLPGLSLIDRTYSWIVPLAPKSVRAWDVHPLLARESAAQGVLDRSGQPFTLNAPDDELLAADESGHVAGERMLLLGGEAATLLFVFALLTSVGLRRTLLAERRRLEQRGARQLQLVLFVATETAALTLAGWVVGLAVAIGVASALDTGALAHALLSARGAVVLACGWVIATALVALPALVAGGGKWRRAWDVAAVAALAAAVVGFLRGGASASALASGHGAGILLLLLPGLLSFAAAVFAARIVVPALRLAERLSRGSQVGLRLAILALARSPGRTAVAVSFLIVSLGLAVLGSSYRATLERGNRDAASFRVPLDFTLSEGTRVVAPLDAAPLRRYDAVAPGIAAYPVVRRSADVAGTGTSRITPVVLGLPPDAVARLRGWRSDFARDSQARLAHLLGEDGSASLRGAALPPEARTVSVRMESRGVSVDVDLALETPRGDFVRVPLRQRRGSVLTGLIPPAARGSKVVGLEVSPTLGALQSFNHHLAEGELSGALAGTLAVRPLRAGGTLVTDWRGWLGRTGAVVVSRRPLAVRYDFTGTQTALLRPRQQTDARPLPAVVSPDVARAAGADGVVALSFEDERVLVRVVAVARRFPTTQDTDGSFVLVDESRLGTALNADAPGSGTPLELWLRVPQAETAAAAAALARPPFDALDVSSRRAIQHDLSSTPLARGTLAVLTLAALLGAVLALGGLWLMLTGDVRDERNALYDLEAEGFRPSALRWHLRLRALTLAVLGAAGGIAFGIVLSIVVVRLVQVTADAATPVPPLQRVLGWPVLAVALAALVLLGSTIVEGTVRVAFREDVPRRPGGG